MPTKRRPPNCTPSQWKGIRAAARAARARTAEKKWYKDSLAVDKIQTLLRKDKPCMDCGVQYPPFVMEFHHARGRKNFNISNLTSLKDLDPAQKLQAIEDEIAKCDLVCVNCHRFRHHPEITNPALKARI